MRNKINEIIKQFNLGDLISMEKIQGGIVNETFKIITKNGTFIIQRLNNILNLKIIPDYLQLQKEFEANGIKIPSLKQTIKGEFYIQDESIWRVFEFIENTPPKEKDPLHIFEAGKMLGKFHKVLKDINYKPGFKPKEFHETEKIIKELKQYLNKIPQEYTFIMKEIENYYISKDLPTQLIHGDPKIENILFKDGKAITIIDLDTIFTANILIDLGDALRSWCRDKNNKFSEVLFNSALEGYSQENTLTYNQKEVKKAICLITLELIARFLIDSIKQNYFVLDKIKYNSLKEQNLDKASQNLKFYKSLLNTLN